MFKKKSKIMCNGVILLALLACLFQGYSSVRDNIEINASNDNISNEEVIVEVEKYEPQVEKEIEVVEETQLIVEEPKIIYDKVVDTVFYGDSWMDNNFFRNRFGNGNTLRVKGSKWAQYFVNNGLVTNVNNAKLVFVQFGLNDWQTGEIGLTNSSYMKRFLDQLVVVHPNIPILITRSPHTGSGYVYKLGNKDINPRCNRYSQYVKEYCDNRENFYYVDVTSCLEDENGWLRPEYVDSSTYHLTQKGYNVWFESINNVLLEYLNK